MIGQIVIHVLLGLAALTSLLFFAGYKRDDVMPTARVLYQVLTFGLLAAIGMLVINVVQHRFEYTYVQSYSSRELPMHLLIASFYSGQEGSFLLWTTLVALIGLALMPYARKHRYEAQVMSFYGLILTFLALLLVAKNPFAFVWETYARDGIANGFIPANGRGLNPLLHNAWITIHPPILFTGFASMSVSFAFAMAGLVRKDYHRWINIALPWTLFGTAVLGFGIMLGGFWAYETLGWGGFWGWDPVENSSLIPWLVSVALVHTMLVQKRTHGLVKTNMVLAVTAFVMVLYSTFLTRSGVLGDTSVHSFVDPGKFAFWILLAFMLTFSVLGAVLILKRRADMNIRREEFSVTTREFMLSIGGALIMASAIFVTIGTSWPVIMEVIGQPKVAVNIDFYNKVHAILLPLILITNALALIVQWRSTPRHLLQNRILWAVAISVGTTIITVVLGIRDVLSVTLAFCAWFSLVVNVQMGWSFMRKSPSMMGAYISHVGIAILVFGVITSSLYTEMHHVIMEVGKPVKVAGMTVTFNGKEQIELQFKDREKFAYSVTVERNGETAVLHPVLYYSDFNRRMSAFLEPGIRWGLLNDLYVSPKATEYQNVFHKTTVQRGSTFVMPLDTSISLQLERFTMPMEEGQTPDGRMQMAAMLSVPSQSAPAPSFKALTRIGTGAGGPSFDPVWTTIPGTHYDVALTRIERNNADPTKSKGEFAFRDGTKPTPVPKEIFTIELSVKPLISLVWIGVITMVLGFFFSIVRWSRMARVQEGPQE